MIIFLLLSSPVCLFIYCDAERSHMCDTQQSGPEQLIQAPWLTWIVEWSIPNFLHVRLILDMAFWFEDVQWTLSATWPWLIHQMWRSYNKNIIIPEKKKKRKRINSEICMRIWIRNNGILQHDPIYGSSCTYMYIIDTR